MSTLLRDVLLVEDGVIRPCDVLISGNRIASIEPVGAAQQADRVVDGRGRFLSHGFIDLHVHGGGGCDFMDGTQEAWESVCALHLQHGTTSLCPTTLASSDEELLQTLELHRRCAGTFPGGVRLLGLHIEGPYLSPNQCGAQDPQYIREPEPGSYGTLLAYQDCIARWTIAPELAGALALGDALTARGILPSIGHSDATYDQVREAAAHGYRHLTHLYSCMSTIVRRQGYRHAGIVESAYLLDELTSEIIADGRHLPQELLQMTYRLIGPRRLALVTDAMRGAGQEAGETILGSLRNGRRVLIEDGVAKMPDRQAFAGSVCTADRLVRTMIRLGGAPLPEAVRMITETPALILGLEHTLGHAAVGRAADLVLFDADIRVHMVLTDGILRHRAEGE